MNQDPKAISGIQCCFGRSDGDGNRPRLAWLLPSLRMAIVFATGGLGDKSFNDSAYEGMKRAETELGIEFDQAEPQAVCGVRESLDEICSDSQIRSHYIHRFRPGQTPCRLCLRDSPDVRSSQLWTLQLMLPM